MPLTQAYRGDDYCPICGSEIKWIRLLNNRWIAVEPEPVLYIPHGGKKWLIEGRRWDAEFLKDCEIWKPGMLRNNIKRGFFPHEWTHQEQQKG